jgi:hypothetical protein
MCFVWISEQTAIGPQYQEFSHFFRWRTIKCNSKIFIYQQNFLCLNKKAESGVTVWQLEELCNVSSYAAH